MTKTREEIEKLKSQWYSDPIWDIENTEGFKDHKQELYYYRMACENRWNERIKKRLLSLSVLFGTENNLILTAQLDNMLNRIRELEHKE